MYPAKKDDTKYLDNSVAHSGAEGEENSFINPNKEEKVVITGDDILIEYVRRLTITAKLCQSQDLPPSIIKKLEAFLNHKVWSSKPSS